VSPRLRKFALTAHVVSSVGWLGAVAAFLVLAVAGLTRDDPEILRGIYVGMALLTWWVIVPLCAASLLTGILQGLGTPWGLLRHYWVLVKLILTVIATVVLAVRLGDIRFLGEQAADAGLTNTGFRDERATMVVHAGGGLLVLLAATILAIFKPPGRTRYGWRRLQQESSQNTPP
jgi:hypothetical protein